MRVDDIVEQDCSIFYVMRVTSSIMNLHISNMKFSSRNEVRTGMRINVCVSLLVCFIYIYIYISCAITLWKYIIYRPCEMICNVSFYCEKLLTPRPTPKLEDHPLSPVRECLCDTFAATPHIWRSFFYTHPNTTPISVFCTHQILFGWWRRMRWVRHVACMAIRWGVYKVLVGKPEEMRPLGRSKRWGAIILKLNFKNSDREVWSGLIWIRVGVCGWLLWTR
jgi:hypothetical protein